jgi:hypothetical protein
LNHSIFATPLHDAVAIAAQQVMLRQRQSAAPIAAPCAPSD